MIFFLLPLILILSSSVMSADPCPGCVEFQDHAISSFEISHPNEDNSKKLREKQEEKFHQFITTNNEEDDSKFSLEFLDSGLIIIIIFS